MSHSYGEHLLQCLASVKPSSADFSSFPSLLCSGLIFSRRVSLWETVTGLKGPSWEHRARKAHAALFCLHRVCLRPQIPERTAPSDCGGTTSPRAACSFSFSFLGIERSVTLKGSSYMCVWEVHSGCIREDFQTCTSICM